MSTDVRDSIDRHHIKQQSRRSGTDQIQSIFNATTVFSWTRTNMTRRNDALPTTPLLASSTPHSRRGVILLICSCWLLSGMYVSVRYASDRVGLDPFFICFARGLIQFTLLNVLLLLYFLHGNVILSSGNISLFMLLRGLLGSLALLSKYESLSRLPVGVAASLFSTTPLFAAFFGFIFVGEKLSNYDVVSIAMCLSGGFLIGNSGGSVKLDGYVLGVLLGITGAAMTALVFVTIRAIGTEVHYFFSVQALSIGAMFTPFIVRVLREGGVGDAWAFIMKNFEMAISTREGSLAVASVGCFSFAAAMCVNRALQLIGAGKASIIRTLDIPFNFVTGFLVMGELPHATGQLVGCALVTAGIFINVAGKGNS